MIVNTLLMHHRLVRDQAAKAMGVFLKRVEEYAATMVSLFS